LGENDFLIACYENKNDDKFVLHVWKGASINIDEEEIQRYLNEIKNVFFGSEDRSKVVEIEETPYSESDDFIGLL
jgi:hypothetical protein